MEISGCSHTQLITVLKATATVNWVSYTCLAVTVYKLKLTGPEWFYA